MDQALIRSSGRDAGPRKTVQEELQDLCNILLDDAINVTWDLYRLDQKDRLEMKVRMAMFSDSVNIDEQTGETSVKTPDPKDKDAVSRENLVQHLINKIWDQKKHTGNECLRMSIVYIGLVNAESLDPLSEINFVIRPIFRLMKCVDRNTRSTEGKCMVFVDEFGWVYQSWKAFIKETLYPDTLIVAPTYGVFSRTSQGDVILSYHKAPRTAEEIKKEFWGNIAMTVGGLASTAVLGAAAFFPITAPFVWGAAAVGTVIGGVAGAKSVGELINRKKHEQDIDFFHKDARAHWLSITGSLVGFLASGAAAVLRSAALAGNVSRSVLYTTNTIFGTSVFINGASIGNSIWQIGVDERRLPTATEVLQLSSSLFLFTHSVYNFQTAQTVVKETQAQHITDYKQTLSKNGQKRFQNKLNGRMKQGTAGSGMGDTIRNLNTAEHYNNNFKGTALYQNTGSHLENKALQQKLTNNFVRYLPESIPILVTLYTIIVKNESEELFYLLKQMAELIIERFFSQGGLTVDQVMFECYRLLKDYTTQRQVSVADCVLNFSGTMYETVPSFIKKWFEMFVPKPGDQLCVECKGHCYKIE